MHERMLRKLKQNRKRVLIRSWELRQLGHAKGAWYRLRYELAMSESVYAIAADQAELLQQTGHAALAAGAELSPPKRLFRVPRDELTPELAAQPLPARLNATLLAAPNLVLVPWAWLSEPTSAGGS